MSEQATRELARLLAADERDIAFLEYLPADSVERLTQAIRETLESQGRALDEAIAEGTRRLPAGLGGVARSILS